jgi:hypothetical protein
MSHNEQDIIVMPKAARVSFLTSTVTAQTAYVNSLSPGGERNDAVLELARLNYYLINANLAAK